MCYHQFFLTDMAMTHNQTPQHDGCGLGKIESGTAQMERETGLEPATLSLGRRKGRKK